METTSQLEEVNKSVVIALTLLLAFSFNERQRDSAEELGADSRHRVAVPCIGFRESLPRELDAGMSDGCAHRDRWIS
jgi:hypothetical protein